MFLNIKPEVIWTAGNVLRVPGDLPGKDGAVAVPGVAQGEERCPKRVLPAPSSLRRTCRAHDRAAKPPFCPTCAKCFVSRRNCSRLRLLSSMWRSCSCARTGGTSREQKSPADARESQAQEWEVVCLWILQPRFYPEDRSQSAPAHAHGQEALPGPPLWQDRLCSSQPEQAQSYPFGCEAEFRKEPFS